MSSPPMIKLEFAIGSHRLQGWTRIGARLETQQPHGIWPHQTVDAMLVRFLENRNTRRKIFFHAHSAKYFILAEEPSRGRSRQPSVKPFLTLGPRLPAPVHPEPLLGILAHIILDHFGKHLRIGRDVG